MEDFVWLKTAPDKRPMESAKKVTGRANLDSGLNFIAKSLRAPSEVSSNPGTLETLTNNRAYLAQLKFAAVVVTDWRPASDSVAAEWRGRVALWDLSARRWVGAVPVHVLEVPARATGAYFTGGGNGDVSTDSSASDRSFRLPVDEAVLRAVAAGTGVDLLYTPWNGALEPVKERAPLFPPSSASTLAKPRAKGAK